MLSRMERMWRAAPGALAALLVTGVLIPCSAASASGAGSGALPIVPSALVSLAVDDQPIERQIGTFAKRFLRNLRRTAKMPVWMFWRAVDWWRPWIKRGLFSFGVAVVAALADGGLVNAWRTEGLRTLLTYSGLMLYVYGRLLFSSGVHLAPKLLLVGALIYGVVRRDLVPDRGLLPGRLDDIILIVIATRTFVYACPEELVSEFADRAVMLKRRVTLPRFRTR